MHNHKHCVSSGRRRTGLEPHLSVDAIVLEDAHAHADAVLAGRVPVVLLHPPVTDQWRVQRREIVACAFDTGRSLTAESEEQSPGGGGGGGAPRQQQNWIKGCTAQVRI